MIVAGQAVISSWVAYLLGSESQNLPAYVVLPDPLAGRQSALSKRLTAALSGHAVPPEGCRCDLPAEARRRGGHRMNCWSAQQSASRAPAR
jgi:hypothetical protein